MAILEFIRSSRPNYSLLGNDFSDASGHHQAVDRFAIPLKRARVNFSFICVLKITLIELGQ